MKRVIPLLIILLSTTSCIYQSMVRFTDEDLLWLTSYHKHDMVLFRTPDNILDTMTIPYIEISNEIFPIYFNPNKSDPYHYNANGDYYFRIKGIAESTELNGSFGCVKKSEDSLRVIIRINDYRYNSVLNDLKSFSLNEVTFDDCLILDLEDEGYYNLNTHLYPKRVTNIVWSRSEGLLQYTIDSTQVYSRLNVLHNVIDTTDFYFRLMN